VILVKSNFLSRHLQVHFPGGRASKLEYDDRNSMDTAFREFHEESGKLLNAGEVKRLKTLVKAVQWEQHGYSLYIAVLPRAEDIARRQEGDEAASHNGDLGALLSKLHSLPDDYRDQLQEYKAKKLPRPKEFEMEALHWVDLAGLAVNSPILETITGEKIAEEHSSLMNRWDALRSTLTTFMDTGVAKSSPPIFKKPSPDRNLWETRRRVHR